MRFSRFFDSDCKFNRLTWFVFLGFFLIDVFHFYSLISDRLGIRLHNLFQFFFIKLS
jgi:hypothetical protein